MGVWIEGLLAGIVVGIIVGFFGFLIVLELAHRRLKARKRGRRKVSDDEKADRWLAEFGCAVSGRVSRLDLGKLQRYRR
jgi:hypothetical protein